MRIFSQTPLFRTLPALVLSLSACGVNTTQTPESYSDVKVVNLPHSDVKKQSIGNCWIYATLGWLESIMMQNAQGAPQKNYSETYLTYRDFQEKLLSELPEKIQTGGSFDYAIDLIAKYGLMEEGDFIPSEVNEPRSAVQAQAVAAINASLKEGALAKARTAPLTEAQYAKLITQELDKAFGVEMSLMKSKIIRPSRIIVGSTPEGTPLTLSDLANDPNYRWRQVTFPTRYGDTPSVTQVPRSQQSFTANQIAVLKRVKQALVDHQPVMIAWFVDFNALKGEAFDMNNLISAGAPGRQGYHLTVLEDFVVSGVDPATGTKFTIGEGEVSQREKAMAVRYGEIDYVVTKNSWGAKPDSSYYRDGTYGYHKLLKNYLFGWVGTVEENETNVTGVTYATQSFILPPGY